MDFNKTGCVLCKRYRAGKYFCRVCGESMCEDCKAIHNNGKATKDHEVVPVTRGTNLPELHPKACSVYPGQMHNLYCEDCDMPACIDCMIKDHSRHKFSKLTDAIAKANEELSSRLKAMKGTFVPNIAVAIENVQIQTNNYDKQTRHVKRSVQTETTTVMEMTQINSDMRKKVVDQNRSDRESLQSMKQILSDHQAKVMKNIKIYKEKIDCEDDIELLKFLKTRQNIDTLMVIPKPTKIQPPSYNTGTLYEKSITDQAGKIVTTEKDQ